MTIREQLVTARRDELLTVKEFASLMRMHERTIYRRIWSGSQAGVVRCGGQWRIDACSFLRNSATVTQAAD